MRFNRLLVFWILATGFGAVDAIAEEGFQIPYELPVYVFDPVRRELVPVRREPLSRADYRDNRDEPGFYLPEPVIERILFNEFGRGWYAGGWRPFRHMGAWR